MQNEDYIDDNYCINSMILQNHGIFCFGLPCKDNLPRSKMQTPGKVAQGVIHGSSILTGIDRVLRTVVFYA